MRTEVNLRPFQAMVTNHLLNGTNVILQAPTGAGKTLAALLPLLHGLENPSHRFPTKCIYTVPRRVLANQFLSKWQRRIKRAGRDRQLPVRIMTGEQPDDPMFEAGLTFATIDQVLSSYLMAPYSLGHRQANINAGAIIASYLVFDEFHLFDLDSTLPTTLEMLHQLEGITPFLLMTATFSGEMIERLADFLDAVIVPDPANSIELEEMLALESQQKTRRLHAINATLTADVVVQRHRDRPGPTLVISNTVARATRLYQEVRERHRNTVLLHSRFLKSDRQAHEQRIIEAFGKDAEVDQDLIAITTQVVEVGLDITCNTMLTELAPANAIVQRAGRCARYSGQEGDVYVFKQSVDLSEGELTEIDLCERVSPYQKQEDVIGATWDVLAEHSGSIFDYRMEQELIAKAHNERDSWLLDGLMAYRHNRVDQMVKVMRGNPEGASRLIRNIRSFRVAIHNQPELFAENPFAIESFSVPHSVAMGMISSLKDAECEMGNPITGIFPLKDRIELDEANQDAYQLFPVNSGQEALGADLIVFHPDVASYSPDQGLLVPRLSDSPPWMSEVKEQGDKKEEGTKSFSYHLESYEEHIRWVWRAFDEQTWPEVERAAATMESLFGWEPGIIRQAAELAVLLHDVGKLSVGWQHWARTWQEAIGEPMPKGMAAAHTEFDKTNPRHRAVKIAPKRPPHAGEGAYASLRVIVAGLSQHEHLVSAVYTAILRHHTPFSESVGIYGLEDSAVEHIQNTLGDWQLDRSQLYMQSQPDLSADRFLINLNKDKYRIKQYPVYSLLVRVLRRADQLGTKEGSSSGS
jgi:CRISPR-associated endonuclease/helicase Cas3